MTIYLDTEYRCHLNDDGGMTPIETDRFDGKCAVYIEGYRYVPDGEVWTRSDGKKFPGLMVAPAESYVALEKAQEQYERDKAESADMEEALAILLGGTE